MDAGGSGSSDRNTVILVTGTNSGVGYAICCRTVDEFFEVQKQEGRSDTTLTLVFTTRSLRKSQQTQRGLESYISSSASRLGFDKSRVTLYPEQLDLSNLFSVRALSNRLLVCPRIGKIDSLILNAGLSGFDGLDYARGVWEFLTNPVKAMTWPSYVLATPGWLNPKQTAREDEPVLGHVFCANVFGHYMLTHYLMPLLTVRPQSDPSRVVWVSSIEASLLDFNIDDIQGLKVARTYQASKYLTDVLVLTSDLPHTRPWVSKYITPSTKMHTTSTADEEKPRSEPNMYACHPGICATSFVPLPGILFYFMQLFFLFCRLLGSPWHVVKTYMGAFGPTFLATAPASAIDEVESPYRRASTDGAWRGRMKFGSACTRFGQEELACTEVEGWGFGGVIGGPPRACEADRRRWRKYDAKDLTEEDKEAFIERARVCWREMEELREKFESIVAEEESAKEKKEAVEKSESQVSVDEN